MFQNLADNIELNQKDVKVNTNKFEILKRVFTVQNIIIYVLSFLVSTVSIKDGITPFAMAFFVAACSSTIPAGAILVTTSIGTIVSFGANAFLTYFLTILIFLLTIVFLKPYVQEDRNEISKLGKNLIISVSVVQAIKLIIGPVLVYDIIMSIVTVILTYVFYKIFVNSIGVLETFGFKTAFTIEEIIGATVLVSIAAVAVSSYRVFGMSIANMLAIFLILVLAWKNGVLVGSTIGVSIGLILGIVGIITPLQVLVFSVSGMIGGALNRLGKLGVICGFFVGNAILSYISTGNAIEVVFYKEILVSSIALLFVPKYIEIDVEDLIGKNKFFNPIVDNRLAENQNAETRLGYLSDTVKEIAKSYGIKDEELVADEVENINKSKETFIEDLLNNLDSFPNNILYEELIRLDSNILEDVYRLLIDKEEINEKDIVQIFEKRNEILDIKSNSAIKDDVDQVVRIINRTYRINEMNFQWKQRLQDNKKSISKQLKGVSKAISEIASEMSNHKEQAYKNKESEIKELLKQKEIFVKELRIKQNKSKKYFIDILFEKLIQDKEKINCIESILTKVCKEKIVLKKDTSHLESKLYMQKYISEDKFSLQIGLATLPKTGNDISGDSSVQIRLEDNKYLIALSDGMGSGKDARKSSQIVTNMLKQTLAAGFEKEDSLELINSTVKLSSEEIYSTMDVAVLDLYTGIVEFIKNGSCRTYIKNKQSIDIVEANSLPIGILNDVDFTVYDKDMKDGDIFVMCSDGIIDSNKEQADDKWFIKMLKEINTNNVKKMADIILREAIDNGYGILKDDMTVIVMKVTKN
ncbi:MAG: SpoIIE family protein phosphatase [Clostridia bacterium]|nr:SpoIIE family protein phosphatase [Clostridia bacterium]